MTEPDLRPRAAQGRALACTLSAPNKTLALALSASGKALPSLLGYFSSTHLEQKQVLPKPSQASDRPLPKTLPLNLIWSYELTGPECLPFGSTRTPLLSRGAAVWMTDTSGLLEVRWVGGGVLHPQPCWGCHRKPWLQPPSLVFVSLTHVPFSPHGCLNWESQGRGGREGTAI